MQIVRINAKIIQDDSGVFTEIPVLLDENQDVIKRWSHMFEQLKAYL